MQIDKRVYVVGSGKSGSNFTDPYDCDTYVVNCGNDLVMIHTGAGISPEKICEQIAFHNFLPSDIKYILLTHTHGDHVGGAAYFKKLTGATVLAHPLSARYLQDGDLNKMSVDTAEKNGLYPSGFTVEKCKASPFSDGEILKVGDVEFMAVDTPGHCSGHNAYLVTTPEKRYLFSGDSIFLGGRISLQNIWDCCLADYVETAHKLERLEFDALLPSHFGIDLSEGKEHIQKAVQIFERLGIPEQAFIARG